MRALVLFSLLVIVAGCSKKNPGACKVTSDCAAGTFCLGGTCGTPCTSNASCPGGSFCSAAGTCAAGSSGAGPTITSVQGTSTLGPTRIAGSGALKILGTNLAGVKSVDLLTPALVEVGSLAISSAEANEVDAMIGGTLASAIAASPDGKFELQASDGKSVARDAVQILQGEPGNLAPPVVLTLSSVSTTLSVSNDTGAALTVSGSSNFTGQASFAAPSGAPTTFSGGASFSDGTTFTGGAIFDSATLSKALLPIRLVSAPGLPPPSQAFAACAGNEILIAGGCEGGIVLTRSMPVDSGEQGINTGGETGVPPPVGGGWRCDSNSGSGTVTAYAFCLKFQ